MPSMNIGDWYQPYEQGNDCHGYEDHYYIKFSVAHNASYLIPFFIDPFLFQ